jgi:tRNA threonylcarbamoyl adenosine modification protein (Sua5/YciO/YrdC/YwlC family)
VARVWNCRDLGQRPARIAATVPALRRGNVAVVPDESMYSLVCDAFSDSGVATVRDIKGRSDQPLTVLVGRPVAVDGVAAIIPAYARDLMAAFWPGPLTLLLRQQPSLRWPLRAVGVAVRMPLHPVMLELVRDLGPAAATSANIAGMPPVATPGEFDRQLADDVDILLDCGAVPPGQRSTVVDATGEHPVVRRAGGLDLSRIREVCPTAADPAARSRHGED